MSHGIGMIKPTKTGRSHVALARAGRGPHTRRSLIGRRDDHQLSLAEMAGDRRVRPVQKRLHQHSVPRIDAPELVGPLADCIAIPGALRRPLITGDGRDPGVGKGLALSLRRSDCGKTRPRTNSTTRAITTARSSAESIGHSRAASGMRSRSSSCSTYPENAPLMALRPLARLRFARSLSRRHLPYTRPRGWPTVRRAAGRAALPGRRRG
jgi:hypothetical protein